MFGTSRNSRSTNGFFLLILDFATFANAFTNTVACGKTSLIPVSKAELHCQQEIGGAGRIRTDE